MSACRDCAPESKRPAPHPGPRCATHHHAAIKARKARSHELRVAAVYGLEPGEYARMYTAQGGKCAICQRARGTGKRRLAVDHDHDTGAVRGLLCAVCNYSLLGRFDAAALLRAVAYLANPPGRP